jgi:hypothetical protein
MSGSIPDKPSQAEGDLGDDDVTEKEPESGTIGGGDSDESPGASVE